VYLKNKKEVSPGAGAAAAAKSVTPCYNIGDTGPAGGIIVSIPGVGQNTSNHLYEMALTPAHEATIADTGVDYSCNSALCGGSQQVAGGVELGCWNQNINSQFGTNTSHEFGEGFANTVNVITNSNNTYHFNSSWSNAFSLASSYSFGGYDDWFLPSVEEVKEASDNGFDVNPGGSLIATSSGYNHSAYSSSLINDQYPALPNNKVFFSFKPGAPYIRCVRGKDLTVIPMRRFICNNPPSGLDCSFYSNSSTGGFLQSNIYPDPTNNISSTPLQPLGYTDKVALALANGVAMPYVAGTNSAQPNGTSAKYGNYGYDKMSGYDLAGNSVGIIKYIIDPVLSTLSWGNHFVGDGSPYYHPTNTTQYAASLALGSAMCAKDEHTLLLAEWDVAKFTLHANGTLTQEFLFKLPTVSGDGYSTLLSSGNCGYSSTGDIIYRPSDDSILITAHIIDDSTGTNVPIRKIFHYSMSGTLLDELDITNPVASHPNITMGIPTLFCAGGDIFGAGGTYLFKFTTNPLAITTHHTSFNLHAGGLTGGDGGTSPECCGIAPPPDPADPCFYNIGDEGPGGGIIFATPTSMPSQNFYYEVATSDISTSNTGVSEFQTVPWYVNPTYINTPAFMPGAEWGAYKSLISLSSNPSSTSFGQGYINTPVIANYPQCNGVPCHPLISNNSIAAELCSSYHSGGKNDWFLPSVDEFNEMFFLGGVPQVSPPNNLYQLSGLYWTSSAVYDPSDNQVDSKAWGFDASNVIAHKGYRDKKLSVRAIRRFECSVCPDGNPACVDYNWVDGAANSDGGMVYDSFGGHPFASNDSVLGGTTAELVFSPQDVLGNQYTSSMFSVGDEFIIKAWRFDYTYFGTWKYTITNSFVHGASGWCTYQMLRIQLNNVVHLDGPNQYVNTNFPDYVNGTGVQYGSATQTFIQIATPGTATTGLANGTQTTMWGNLPYTGRSYWDQELPYRCTPLVGSIPSCYEPCSYGPGSGCIATYTVSPIYAGAVHATITDCWNSSSPPSACCGGATSAAMTPVGYKSQVKKEKYKESDILIVSMDQLKNYNPGKGEPCKDCGE